ncbi:MAG: transglycosylase SLT domain-containing protein [Deltaproteobacteria bacterium]|nr:transglycosylase SLT domain-containing protein [Deltaproteobacteria bacterium]
MVAARACVGAGLALALASPRALAQSAPSCAESAALAQLRRAGDAPADAPPRPATVADAARALAVEPQSAGLDARLAAELQLTSLPVRVSPRLLRELAELRAEGRARRVVSVWIRHGGRYEQRIMAALEREGMPVELLWVAAAESDFDPRAVSHAGAVGLWQLMPDAARTYGLRVDDWLDERRDVDRSTEAAARYLRDLYQRFGTWELALSAYNMGYNGLLRSIRKYGTTDPDALSSLEGALPWETQQYAPRILAVALVARNLPRFGIDPSPDPEVAWDDVEVTGSIALADLVREARVRAADLTALNPALLRARTPPGASAEAPFRLHVPPASANAVRAALPRLQAQALRPYTLRYGEALDEVAARWGLRPRALRAQSGLADNAIARPGDTLLVPPRDPSPLPGGALPVVPVDPSTVAPPGHRRVFVRVADSDPLEVPARALGVPRDTLARWNGLDPRARVQQGLWLQVFLRGDPPEGVRVYQESEVEALPRDSEAFADRSAASEGLARLRVTVAAGDTLASVAARHGLTAARLARINNRSPRAALVVGETLVVYVPLSRVTNPPDPTPTDSTPPPPTRPDDGP